VFRIRGVRDAAKNPASFQSARLLRAVRTHQDAASNQKVLDIYRNYEKMIA
jgi:hypothetical protein